MSTAAGFCLKKVVVSHLGSLSPCSLKSASWQGYWWGGITCWNHVFCFFFWTNMISLFATVSAKIWKGEACLFKRMIAIYVKLMSQAQLTNCYVQLRGLALEKRRMLFQPTRMPSHPCLRRRRHPRAPRKPPTPGTKSALSSLLSSPRYDWGWDTVLGSTWTVLCVPWLLRNSSYCFSTLMIRKLVSWATWMVWLPPTTHTHTTEHNFSYSQLSEWLLHLHQQIVKILTRTRYWRYYRRWSGKTSSLK